MLVYVLACYPTCEYDDCLDEIYLTNKIKYSKHEFEKQCREVGSNRFFDIEKFLKEQYGYKELEANAVVDIREW